jgi:hypothetical protein
VANEETNSSVPPTNKNLPPFKYWFWGNIFDLLRINGRTFLVCLLLVFTVAMAAQVAKAYVGTVTITNVNIRILVSVALRWAVTMTVSGLSLGLYFRERRQHERTRERLTKRITELEKIIDERRSSSKLTPRGRTGKGDE